MGFSGSVALNLAMGGLGFINSLFEGARAREINEGLRTDITGILQDRQRREAAFNDSIMSDLRGHTSNIDRLLRGRTSTVMGEISKLGQQGRFDIQREFGNASSNIQANLTSRGLAGTSLASSARSGSCSKSRSA